MNMQNLMAQAKKMQRDIEKKQEEINNEVFDGVSQFVKVEVKGTKEVIKVDIDKSVLSDEDDLEALEDMIVISLNDAFSKVDNEVEKKLGAYSKGLGGLM